MKKSSYILTLLFSIFMFACTNEIDDVFDQSPAERIDSALKEYEEILTSAPNGWLMEYYAGTGSRMLGGYNMICSFDKKQNVTILSEIDIDMEKPETSKKVSSLYKLIADQGPVLTFDTYNTALHYFSDPGEGPGAPSGFGGDYEFVITEATDDVVTMTGKKGSNKITLKKLPEGLKWETYLSSVISLQDEVIYDTEKPRMQIISNGKVIGDLHISEYFQFQMTIGEEVLNQNAIFTSEGCTFYEPVTIGGVECTGFTFNKETHELTSVGGDSKIILKGYLPQNFNTYDSFIGGYKAEFINYSNAKKTKNVEIVADKEGNSYKIVGMASYPLPIKFDRTQNGTVYFKGASYVGDYYGAPVKLYGWFGGGSFMPNSFSYEYKGQIDPDANELTLVFSPNSLSAVGIISLYYDNGYGLFDADMVFQSLKMTKQ